MRSEEPPAGTATSSQQQEPEEETTELDSGNFELVSIVTHRGRSADGGHYVGWTKKDDEWWYKFDDNDVTEVKWKDLDLSGGRSDYHIATLLMFNHKRVRATPTEIREVQEQLEKEAAAKASGDTDMKTTIS